MEGDLQDILENFHSIVRQLIQFANNNQHLDTGDDLIKKGKLQLDEFIEYMLNFIGLEICSILGGTEMLSQSSLEILFKNLDAFFVAAQLFSFMKMNSQVDDQVQKCFIKVRRLQAKMRVNTEKRSLDREE